MPVRPLIPRELRLLPFRGSVVIEKGVISRAALRGRAWRRLLPDIYIGADVPLDHRLWCYAAALYAEPDGAVSGLSAAYLWGIDLLPRGDPAVEVTVPRSVRRPNVPDVVIVRSVLAPGDVRLVSGTRVTSAERTAFDLGRRLARVDAVIALDALCFRRVVVLADVVAYSGMRPRWPGGVQLADALEIVEPLSESPMETQLRLQIVDAGLPRPVAQFEVRHNGRFVGRLDLAYPQWMIGIEYDGDFHRGRETFRTDLARQNRLSAAGWTIVRFTASDVLHNPARIDAILRAIIPAG